MSIVRKNFGGLGAGPVRQALRSATAASHERLHRAAPFARIADGTMDRAGYADLLARVLSFHHQAAPLCRVGARSLGIPKLVPLLARRRERLRRDLDYLNVKRRPSLETPPLSTSEPFAVGCLYAVQGSSLGGKVIARQLDRLFPTVRGREFFAGDPEDGTAWRMLCAKLEIYGGTGGRMHDLVAGADHGFRLFASCLGVG